MTSDGLPGARRLDRLDRRPLGSGDEWVDGDQGRFWGAFGAAGLLVATAPGHVLLQLRAPWSHFGGTWGLPGGARKQGESAERAALREAHEEAGVPVEGVRIVGESLFDVGYWSYTTVLGIAPEPFEPVISDAESDDLAWIAIPDVAQRSLHPGFRASWPGLRPRIEAALDESR